MTLRKFVSELNNELLSSKYYQNEDEILTNEMIHTQWKERFFIAVSHSIHEAFGNLQIEMSRSNFEINSEDEQGATVFKAFLNISEGKENIQIIVKTLINLNKTKTYLGSRHAIENKFEGSSRKLASLFKILKQADQQIGYFNPIDLMNLN